MDKDIIRLFSRPCGCSPTTHGFLLPCPYMVAKF